MNIKEKKNGRKK